MARIEEIVGSIDGRLEELGREIAALSQARAALDGRSAAGGSKPRSAARQTNRRRRAPARARRARRPEPRGSSLEQVLATGQGPSSATALAKRLGAKREEVLAELVRLERTGRVRHTGTRTVRWQLVTDEERVAVRAAAARSGKPA